jgi:hypothetical protein
MTRRLARARLRPARFRPAREDNCSGVIRFPMELHTEEGITPGVPEAELTIQETERSVKKGVIPTLRMLEVTCACVSGACVHLRPSSYG